MDEIEEYEENHIDSEKENGKYYIGLCQHDRILASTISVNGFYKYSIDDVTEYLYEMSVCENTPKRVEIIKLRVLEDGTYLADIKTDALIKVQRRWRRIYSDWLKWLKNLNTLRGREMGILKITHMPKILHYAFEN